MGITTCLDSCRTQILRDGDCQANATVGSAVYERAGGWRVGIVGSRTGGRLWPPGPGGPGSRAQLSLVPGRPMEPGLGRRLQLGLESLPRLGGSARPKRSGGLGALGAAAAVGGAAATSPAVGARGSADVEPHRQWLGILEQRNMDSGLTNQGQRQSELRFDTP
jgi:hypothetical protein